MASTVETPSGQKTELPRSDSPARGFDSKRSRTGSQWGKWVFMVLLVIGVIAAGYYVYTVIAGYREAGSAGSAVTYAVEPDRLLITVNESGNVESSSNVDVKCQVAGGAAILWIIDDGTEVEKGQEIVRLDDSSIQDQLNAQKITYEKALATKIQAEEDYGAAVIAVKEYTEGTYVKELQDVEANITIALENLRSAENILEHTKKMFRKGFTTKLQLEADEFAVRRAQLELDSANTAKRVLQDFTREKMVKDLESQSQSAAARLRSEQAALALEESRLKQLEQQLSNCTIMAPQKGMVVYANSSSSWRSSQPSVSIEEGAMVRERQTIVQLPDLSKMQVKVSVHETKVDQITPGMPARVTIMDRVFKGRVKSVANQPEASSFMSTNVKVYSTVVEILDDTSGLRPGMTAETEILVAELDHVLAVPVQGIVEQRGKFFCWVQKPDGPERRNVVLGKSNDKMIEIKDGLLAGDMLLLNPRAMLAEARDEDKMAQDEKSKGSFGPAAKEGAGSSPQAPGAAQGLSEHASNGKETAGPKPEAESQPQTSRRSGGAGGFDLFQYDKDGDGKVSKEEAPEQMQRMFEFGDTNGDGAIDRSEADAMRRRFQARGGASGGADAPGAP